MNPLIQKLLAATTLLLSLVSGGGNTSSDATHLVKYKDLNDGKKKEIWVGKDDYAAVHIAPTPTTCSENNKLQSSGDGTLDSHFATLNCSTKKKRKLQDISIIVIHEGGQSISSTVGAWIGNTNKKRETSPDYPQIAAHYEIDRDGTVKQTLAETLIGVHADSANRYAIGIDLIIPSGCSQSESSSTFKTCANYTDAQYTALKTLIENIGKRTAVKLDDNQVIGHCEVCDSTHADPRGMDWTKIGLTQSSHTMGPDGLGCIKRWTPQGGACDWKVPKKKDTP